MCFMRRWTAFNRRLQWKQWWALQRYEQNANGISVGGSNEESVTSESTGHLCSWSSTLDCGLATNKVAESLEATGYEVFNKRFPTDHRAYYFDLNTEQLFGTQHQPLASPSLRMMQSSSTKQVTQNLQEKSFTIKRIQQRQSTRVTREQT